MLTSTTRFADTITHGGTVIARLEVLENGEVLDTYDDLLLDGSVSKQRQLIRSTCQFSIVDADGVLTPTQASDYFVPFGNEIRLWRGFKWWTGSELVPLGTFLITDVDITWPRITIQGQDRMAEVQLASFEYAYTIAKGLAYEDEIQNLLTFALPQGQASFNFGVSGELTPQLAFEYQADRAEAAVGMATAIGAQLYPDPYGTFVMPPETDPMVDPISAFYVEGETALILPGATRSLSSTDAKNAVVATGENSSNDQTFRGVAYDLDPLSPTQYGSKFGRRPMFYSSPLLASNDQCAKAANTILQKQLGITESVTFTGFVDPRLEVSDIVRVEQRNSGIATTHILDQITIPLRASESMSATTRARQVVSLQ